MSESQVTISFTVNGEPVSVDVHPMARLLDVVRRQLHLTGTKEGCGEGECGACGVLLDGVLVNSCLTPLAHAEGAAITTIEGGVAQGIGWALYEDVVWREGRMANAQMTNYIMPTSMDLPPIRVFFEETPYPYGPAGAKGIGELPMDGPAPAIFNAVANATGLDVTRLPLTPERLMALMEVPVA